MIGVLATTDVVRRAIRSHSVITVSRKDNSVVLHRWIARGASLVSAIMLISAEIRLSDG